MVGSFSITHRVGPATDERRKKKYCCKKIPSFRGVRGQPWSSPQTGKTSDNFLSYERAQLHRWLEDEGQWVKTNPFVFGWIRIWGKRTQSRTHLFVTLNLGVDKGPQNVRCERQVDVDELCLLMQAVQGEVIPQLHGYDRVFLLKEVTRKRVGERRNRRKQHSSLYQQFKHIPKT